jgi:hypothetical protein
VSIEDDIGRQLQAKATSVRVAPDLRDLSSRIRVSERRATRHERLALGAAIVVLSASLGGLAGAMANAPRAKSSSSFASRYEQGETGAAPTDEGKSRHRPKSVSGDKSGADSVAPAPAAVRTVIDQRLRNGVTVTATVQPLMMPVAISGQGSASLECATGEIVMTTVGEGGSFGGGTSVAGLPSLGAGGLEILSSGVLQVSGGGQLWWVTTAVGGGVSRVAAENLGGAPVVAEPSDGIAIIVGSMSGSSAASGEMSAVAEGVAGDESLGFLLGSGPRAVGVSATESNLPGCSALRLPAEPSSASSSQPAEPPLAAASIIAAFEQGYSANPLLGFAANLAAVSDSASLSTPVPSSKRSPARTEEPAQARSGGAPGDGAVEVRQVWFRSAWAAEVIYRVSGGVLETGDAQLSSSGIWQVSRTTFCENLRSGLVEGDVPIGVASGCETQR